jgi:hypothetical protein
MMRSQKQPQSLEPWLKDINVEVIRVRFTPTSGLFYGPKGSSEIRLDKFSSVPPKNAFLDGDAGWRGVCGTPNIEPGYTFDGGNRVAVDRSGRASRA